MAALENLKSLKEDMQNKGWVISSFCFNYENSEYIALVILYQPNETKQEFGLLKIDFLRANDISQHLLTEANATRLLGSAKEIREFFGIKFGEKIGDSLRAFYRHLGTFVPKLVPMNINDSQRTAMVASLSHDDAENANKIYCYKVRRNPQKENGTNGQRSPFNDNKTRLLRFTLYEKLKDDWTLSFCYSEDPKKEKSDEEIIRNWSNNNHS